MATRVLFDGYEGQGAGNWSPTGSWSSEKGSPQVVTTATNDGFSPRTGSNMLRLNHGGSTTFDSAEYQTTGNYTSEFFIRVYFRFDSNVSQEPGLHFSRFLNASVWIDWLFGTWDDPLGGNADSTISQININSVSQDQSFGSINDLYGAAWHKQEWYVNISTGTVKNWLDGTLYADATGMDLNGTVPGLFYLVSNWTPVPADSTNHIYYDDFEFFSDSTGGEATTGSMSDATIQAGADTTAPILSNPFVTGVGYTGFTASGVTTDEGNGTMYAAVVKSPFSITDAQLKAGSGGDIETSNGTPIAGSAAVSASGVVNTGASALLRDGTLYRIYFLHSDSSGNDSATANVEFTTLAVIRGSSLGGLG